MRPQPKEIDKADQGRGADLRPPLELFGSLRTEANAVVAPIHPKAMPVILTTLADSAWHDERIILAHHSGDASLTLLRFEAIDKYEEVRQDELRRQIWSAVSRGRD